MALVKKGVIVDSAVPKMLQRACKIFISSAEPGTFQVEVKLPAASETIEVQISELLERRDKNVDRYEHDHVTLDVNLTLHLFNSLYTKK